MFSLVDFVDYIDKRFFQVKYEDKTKVLSYDEILEKFCGFVTRLLNQLTNLHEKQLLPFNASPLIRTIDMVDDKLME